MLALDLGARCVQNSLFNVHDASLFQGNGKFQEKNFHLGVFDCKVYHHVCMNSQSQVDDFRSFVPTKYARYD
jgi:hypothetical protein